MRGNNTKLRNAGSSESTRISPHFGLDNGVSGGSRCGHPCTSISDATLLRCSRVHMRRTDTSLRRFQCPACIESVLRGFPHHVCQLAVRHAKRARATGSHAESAGATRPVRSERSGRRHRGRCRRFAGTARRCETLSCAVTHLGWKDGAEWDLAYAHFQRGWTDLLDRLKRRFASGPIDWNGEPMMWQEVRLTEARRQKQLAREVRSHITQSCARPTRKGEYRPENRRNSNVVVVIGFAPAIHMRATDCNKLRRYRVTQRAPMPHSMHTQSSDGLSR